MAKARRLGRVRVDEILVHRGASLVRLGPARLACHANAMLLQAHLLIIVTQAGRWRPSLFNGDFAVLRRQCTQRNYLVPAEVSHAVDEPTSRGWLTAMPGTS